VEEKAMTPEQVLLVRASFAQVKALVDALDRLHDVLPAVRDLGRRHARYGALPEHYATVGSALI
jgi:nitric oxide dioxygenase